MQKQIVFSNQEYKILVEMCEIAKFVLGLLGDSFGKHFKEKSNRFEQLSSHILSHAKEFNYDEIVDVYKDEVYSSNTFSYEILENYINPYDDIVTTEQLTHDLAWRDFTIEKTPEELALMEERNGGYWGVDLYPYEEKYWNEFEKHNFDRLFILGE